MAMDSGSALSQSGVQLGAYFSSASHAGPAVARARTVAPNQNEAAQTAGVDAPNRRPAHLVMARASRPTLDPFDSQSRMCGGLPF